MPKILLGNLFAKPLPLTEAHYLHFHLSYVTHRKWQDGKTDSSNSNSSSALTILSIFAATTAAVSSSRGQLAVGTCEIVMLNRDSSVPRRTIARQTARCACRRGQIAGTTRARPACVDARIVRSRQWCEMAPCMEGEVCSLLFNRSGWTCTRGSGRIKTVTPLPKEPS
ncbi:chemokine-like protein TAFA-5 [Maylandia zebra]|uniref:chemokine-like protein TAFA-5 n=1 Tax=Maylandia zebra TaxID=106582 RepID=UPI00403D08D6